MGGANLVWVEQIWIGRSKFGVGGVDVGRTVWRVAEIWRTRCCVSFYFCGLHFFKLDTYIQ